MEYYIIYLFNIAIFYVKDALSIPNVGLLCVSLFSPC